MTPPSFSMLLDTSLRVSVVILLLLGLRPVLRRWIGSRVLAWLWLIVAARLLFPLPLSAPWHLPLPLAAPLSAAASPFTFRVFVSDAAAPGAPARAALGDRQAAPMSLVTRENGLALLWLTGALLALARLAWGQWTIRRWAARAVPPAADSPAQTAYLALPARLRRNVALRLTDALDAPALIGILRPQIWLPRTLADTLTPDELHHVLLHELGHARRRDLLAQWVCALACCFHWFNPLVWLGARLARADRELACDHWVLSQTSADAETSASYGHTLLKVVAGMRRETPRLLPAVSMAAGKRHVGLRVREILGFRPVARWRGAIALVVTLAAVAAVTMRAADPTPETSASPVSISSALPPAPEITPSPTPDAVPPAPVAAAPVPVAPSSPAPSAKAVKAAMVSIETKIVKISEAAIEAFRQSARSNSPSKLAAQVVRIYDSLHAGGMNAPAGVTDVRAVYNPAEYEAFVRQLNEQKGVDLLSAPRVTTKSGQRATIEIIREFPYPVSFAHGKDPDGKPMLNPTNFDKANVGLTLEVEPSVPPEGDTVDLRFAWKNVNFIGYIGTDGQPLDPKSPDNGKRPVFSTHSMSTVVTLASGSTLLLGAREEKGGFRQGFDLDEKGQVKPDQAPVNPANLVLCLVTATIVEAKGVPFDAFPGERPPPTSPTPADAPSPALGVYPSRYPWAIAVPDKPGFVTSPYAPEAGYVDVTGFNSGQPFRDPYSKKMLLVP